ncbi:MAG TPA: aminotransferase class III-fold pyridoxal phosphate-dependent enzyme [Solirubrobacteraceae bacterium]|nr:aminotransferase class III-fold pyridoxal phosphate-dependent enzyme [Solirubrobacteraceae bacterium]
MATTPHAGAALWSPQAHMPSVPGDRLTIVAGEGANVQTDDGRWLLDATAGLWHANIGHGRARLADAAAAQMRRLETYHTFGRITNDQALVLADRVAAYGAIEDAKVFWVSGGSDAIDTAAKLARRHWQLQGQANKRIIVSRDASYHGLHAFGTSLAGIGFNREGYGSESLIPETARVPANDADALDAQIRALGPDRVAAVFAEPVIGTGGVIPPAEGYLQRVEAICREHDVLLVLDEVITGFGRTGEMFATQLFDLRPDMITMAKGITSGYAPLGGVLIAPQVWRPFFEDADAPIFRHGVTYSGHATACAVAQANLDVIEEEDLVARVASLTPQLADAVAPLADHPLVVEVRAGVGLLAGVQLAPDVSGDAVTRRCLEDGVLLRVITNNTLQISPPFVVDADDLHRIAAAIARALDTVAG